VREWFEAILVCLLFVIFVRAFVVQQSEIPSGSMEDSVLIGDYVLVNRFLYAPTSFEWEQALLPLRSVRRGDVIVFGHPDRPEQDYVKRVIGLPGEVVELRQGVVLVDGRPLHEPYVNPLYVEVEEQEREAVTVPDGHFFVLGDHRNRSADSRSWGTVPTSLIKGRAFLILMSTETASTPRDDPGRVTALSPFIKLYNLVFRGRWDRALRPLR
jgi:signal peptidase I